MIRTLLLLIFAFNIGNGLPLDEQNLPDYGIVGVESIDTRYEYFPYMVSIKYTKSGKVHKCGGSIIARRTILTTTHCITGVNHREVNAIAGISDLVDNGPRYRASELIIHPEFNSTTLANDIGLIIVSRDIEYTQKVGSIGFGSIHESQEFDAYVVGWGKLANNHTGSNELKYIYMRKVSESNCELELQNPLTEMCIKTNVYEGLCPTDDGNAVVYRNKVVGVVSRINNPCGDGRPQVVTRISGYYNWIGNNLQQ